MKSKIKKLICILAAAVLVLSMTAPVFADQDMIDPSRECSITLVYKDRGNNPLKGMLVKIYKVADVMGETISNAANGYDISYSLTGSFSMYDENTGFTPITGFSEQALNDALIIRPGEGDADRRARWQRIAVTLDQYARRDVDPSGSKWTDNEGKAIFNTLQPGLYLLLADGISVSENDADYEYTYAPTWVMLPRYNNGIWDYNGDYTYDETNGVLRPKYSYEAVPYEYEVVKRWVGDSASVRPDSVTVEIYRDNALYDTVVLNESNGWHYSWTGSQKSYWRVVERSTSNNYSVSISSGKVTGSFTITNTYNPPPPPIENPKVYKKILENNESGYAGNWGDGADYDIGDDIPYRLIGTVPDLSNHSGSYYYRFNDAMDNTLKFDPSSVRVYLFTPSSTVDDYDVETAADLSSMGTYTELTSGFSLAKNSTDTAFQVIFSNLKAVSGITNGGTGKGKYIIVEFTASIQPNAVAGSTIGNANEVTLTYSSSSTAPPNTPPPSAPSAEAGTMGNRSFRLLGSTPGWGNIDDTVTPTGTETTEKDEVVAYTWKLPVLKVDKYEEPLPGAEFLVLYAPSADLIETVRNAAIAFAGRSDENPISDEDKDYVLKVNRVSDGTYRPNGYFSRADNDNLENAAVMVTGENGQINITGVDQGYYFLVEYKAPTGFQRLFDPVYVHVTPEHIYDNADPFERTDTYVDGHEPDAEGDQLSAYYIYTDKNNDGKCTADETVDKVAITNGGSLPSTGGIGTTGIYIAGITLMSGAALLMIIRRKRKAG